MYKFATRIIKSFDLRIYSSFDFCKIGNNS